MKNLLTYIVFALFYFNMSITHAVQIETAFTEEDQIPIEDTAFKGAVNLPHPIDMARIIKREDGFIGNLLLIGGYFDLKYPGDAISTDFSEDIEQMFPGLDSQTASSRATLIRYGIRIYRWGKQKYEDIKEQLLVPPEPPLIVEDEDISFPEEFDYIPTEEGMFAIKTDFKKVVPYSSNPRDIAALKAKRQREAENKNNKTDLDQFKSMVNKLEFSKIPLYGITKPDPLVGNAGVSPWETQEYFSVRLITELSEHHNVPQFLGGIHVKVPAHRYILANTLPDNLEKPKIELIHSVNIKKFEAFYPMPDVVIAEEIVGGYSGDFLFPIKITVDEPFKPIELTVKTTFNSCDARLDCQPLEFISAVKIDTASIENYSSFQNFIRQSYYNLPTPETKNFHLEKSVPQISENNIVENINLVFSYHDKINNFTFVLEDDDETIFQTPTIKIDKDKIYVSVKPLTNQDVLFGKNVTISARLNAFNILRQNIGIVPYTEENFNISYSVKYSFLAGLIMMFTPIGFLIFCTIFSLRRKKEFIRQCQKTLSGIFFGAVSAAALLIFLQDKHIFLYWGMQYQSVICMITAIAFILFLKKISKSPNTFKYLLGNSKGFILGLTLIFSTPVSFVPYLKENLLRAYNASPLEIIYVILLFSVGCCVPYLIGSIEKCYFSKKNARSLQKPATFLFLGQFLILSVILCMQYDFSTLKTVIILLLCLTVIFMFLSGFETALRKTDLPISDKKITEKIILMLGAFTIFVFIKMTPSIPVKDNDTTIISQEEISKKIRQGKIILVRIEADWCLVCRLNDILTFRPKNIKYWQSLYNVEFFTIHANRPAPEISAYLEKMHRVSAPLYVLYSYHAENGLILPDFLTRNEVSKSLRNFSF